MAEQAGFFSRSEVTTRKPTPRLPQCGKCGLSTKCMSPVMPIAGLGKKSILIIGEAPGATEDKMGKPFIGDAGQRLQTELRSAGIDIFKDCWVTNALSCRPPNNKIEDKRQIEYCRPLVLKAIETLQPTTIILLGESAVRSVIGYLWKERIESMGQWAGWWIPCRRWNCWICPAYHPSFLLRQREDPVANMMFRDHIRNAVKTADSPPYDEPQDPLRLDKEIRVILDDREAAHQIENYKDGAVAFDFETTTLKSQGPHAEIYCCSISDGENTISYPWYGKVIQATKEMLVDPNLKKIGWNAKFESNWCWAKLGIRVRGWVWDGMIATHALDTRPSITSLKFQAFIRYGIENYALSVEEYLKSKDDRGNSPNRIKEAGLRQVLEYCGQDSLLEYRIGVDQQKEFEEHEAPDD